MARSIRLIGGTNHGTTQTISDSLRSIRMVAKEPRWHTVSSTEAEVHRIDINVETYERRTLAIGSGVKAEVFVLDRLSDAQAARALADLIEGVQR
jgi:hypothetical protein